jgi:hypothetical protein
MQLSCSGGRPWQHCAERGRWHRPEDGRQMRRPHRHRHRGQTVGAQKTWAKRTLWAGPSAQRTTIAVEAPSAWAMEPVESVGAPKISESMQKMAKSHALARFSALRSCAGTLGHMVGPTRSISYGQDPQRPILVHACTPQRDLAMGHMGGHGGGKISRDVGG